IVAHLFSFVRKSEAAEAMKLPTKDLQAYDLVLQALARFTHDSKDAEGLLSARGLFQRALDISIIFGSYGMKTAGTLGIP
ncbi:hypothetical protein ACC780_38165, partial [Rhizobium ruizarguesonis]